MVLADTIQNPDKLLQYLLNNTAVTDNGCWEYTRYVNAKGYPVLKVGRRNQGFHRFVHKIINSQDPPVVMHICDNSNCVNPLHLKSGTVYLNNKDRHLKGRTVSPNAAKTHCVSGHPLSGENLVITKLGYRRCRSCNLRSTRDCKRRKRESNTN